jgi:hypothetical protein
MCSHIQNVPPSIPSPPSIHVLTHPERPSLPPLPSLHPCAHTPRTSLPPLPPILPSIAAHAHSKADGARRVGGSCVVRVFDCCLSDPTNVWLHDPERGSRVHLRRAQRNSSHVVLRPHWVYLCSSSLSIHHAGLHQARELTLSSSAVFNRLPSPSCHPALWVRYCKKGFEHTPVNVRKTHVCRSAFVCHS